MPWDPEKQNGSQSEEFDHRRDRSKRKLIDKNGDKNRERYREKNRDRSPLGHSGKSSQPKHGRAKTESTYYVGLQNPGNTCYLNALLQCLFLTPEFKQKFSPDVQQDSPVYSAVQRIFLALEMRKTEMTSFELNNNLELPSFKQHDVPEVFQLLLNKLESDSTEGLHFKEVFKATLVNLTKCAKCNTKDGLKTGSGIVILPLAVLPRENTDEHWSVAKALKQFLHEDTMVGENQIYCSTCRMKTDTKLRQTFTSLPQILVVQLKRFEYNFSINQFVKLDSTISINMNLELPCVTATHLEKKLYDLFAICDHHSGIYGGHYTALIQPIGSDTWHSFNDSMVKTENLQHETENMMPCNDDSILLHSDTAYLLMYRQRPDSAPKKDKSPAHDESTKPLEQKGEGDGGPLARQTGNDEHRALLRTERADSRGSCLAISHSSSDPSLCQKNRDPRRSKTSNTKNAEWDESHTEPQEIVKSVPRLISQYSGSNTDINLPANTEHNMTNGNMLQQIRASCFSIFQSALSCCQPSTET